ncbi:MAG TPA: class I SAM-dependent methyltransferase [Acidimicrobiales bacterium]
MPADLRAAAEAAKGFMPPDEGLALFEAGLEAGLEVPGRPLVEIGSWCGKSAVYLGAAARLAGTVLLSVDHHRGSEENQAGWEHHDATLVDPSTGLLDTLPTFRRTVHDAGLDDVVVAVVGSSVPVALAIDATAALVFIDGGHGAAPAHADYEAWSTKVAPGGHLAIHDVFPDPADGGRPPYEIYLRAVDDGFEPVAAAGSLRVLCRPGGNPGRRPSEAHE